MICDGIRDGRVGISELRELRCVLTSDIVSIRIEIRSGSAYFWVSQWRNPVKHRALSSCLFLLVLGCGMLLITACTQPTPSVITVIPPPVITIVVTATQLPTPTQLPMPTPVPPSPTTGLASTVTPSRVPPLASRTPTPPPLIVHPLPSPPLPKTATPTRTPTRTITPTATRTPTQPPPVTHSTGLLTIQQTYLADLDAGTITTAASADIWFQAATATQRYVTPVNGARIAKVGTTLVGQGSCAAAPLSNARININDLPVGSYVCARTNQGRYSQFQINAAVGPSPGKLVIRYTTWR